MAKCIQNPYESQRDAWHTFFRLHKVERIGMGIRKMKEAMIAAGLREPTFEPNAFFRAVLHRSPEFAMKEEAPGAEVTGKEPGLKTTQKTAQKATQKTISLIQKRPEISRQEMAIELGITESGIKYQLKKIQDKGVLRRVGPDKGGHWELVQ